MIDEKTLLNDEIERVLHELQKHDIRGNEYSKTINYLEKLYRVRGESSPRPIDPNIVVSAVTSILGIVMILSYERLGIITSKAMSLVRRV